MTKIKGKRGQLLLYGLIAGLIAAIVISFINNVVDKKEFPVIGDSSLSLMDSSIEAEKALLYIDQSARYSTYQSIYDTAKIGGCNNEDAYSGYALWNVNEQEANPSQCNPSSQTSKNNFPNIFGNNLNNYLSKYEKVKIPLNNYNFNFDNNILRGIAKNSLVVQKEIPSQLGQPDANGIYRYTASGATPLWYRHTDGAWQWTPYEPPTDLWMPVTTTTVSGGNYDGRKPAKANIDIINYLNENVIYSIKPSFKADLGDYNFSDYDDLRDLAGALISGCKGKNSGICVVNNKNIFNKGSLTPSVCEGGSFFRFLDYIWDSDIRYSIYGFCVKSKESKVYSYDSKDGKVDLRDVEYKFALQLKDIQCTLDDNANTKCLNELCGRYSSCASAENLCYCTNSLNACEGACLPYCSDYTGPAVPPQLGQPDANGIYKYMAPGATPLWYRHIGNGDWQWTPYDPYSTPKCWMPMAETTVSSSCGGKWDGQKPVQANIDIITYLNENKPIPSTASLIIDSDADTTCADFSCGSYLSCSTVNTCGCSVAANACKGNNCQTLHCSRDSGFESKTGINTACKDQCSKYGDCSSTDLCACDSGLDSCQGSCYCNPQGWENTGGCGDAREDSIDCDWSEIPQKQEYDPPTCSSPDYRCESQPESVCPEPAPSPVPAPTPIPTPPAGDSCEGRCGNFDPGASCQCDSPCSDPNYDDCCEDISQWCS